MVEHVTLSLIDEIRQDLHRLHEQPELDSRDRRAVFIANDILSNLSPFRDRQFKRLEDLFQQGQELEGGE